MSRIKVNFFAIDVFKVDVFVVDVLKINVLKLDVLGARHFIHIIRINIK